MVNLIDSNTHGVDEGAALVGGETPYTLLEELVSHALTRIQELGPLKGGKVYTKLTGDTTLPSIALYVPMIKQHQRSFKFSKFISQN